MKNNGLFDNINYFKTNSDLFINFAFFHFINLLGSPFIDKISNSIQNNNSSTNFFNNLKVKCKFEEITKNSQTEGYLKILFDNPQIDGNDFDTYIYSILMIRGKRIDLNRKEDKYDPLTSRIKLSKKTLNKIHKQVKIGKTCSDCEILFDDEGIKHDTILNNLITLYLNNKYDNKSDYKDKINTFKTKLTSNPFTNKDTDKTIFEIDKNGNNKIKYENLKQGEIYFIQGPPGTGKTYVINRLIREINEISTNKFDKIIVSSYVHVAINNIIEHMLGKEIPNNKYHPFYDFYQYQTILYSNRALSNIEKSKTSELIELDKLLDEEHYDKAEEIYSLRKNKSKELINDFEQKLTSLQTNTFKQNISTTTEEKLSTIEGDKFKRILKILNNSGEKYINYENAFKLINDLSSKYEKEFVKDNDINWAIANYSNAIKNYSNIIFCSLNNLQKELDRQKSSEKILVIIDEASKSTIINYLLILNNLENITLLILGDPEQLNQSLVFNDNIEQYAKIMTAFTYSNLKDEFLKDNYTKKVIDHMKEILYKLISNKDNRPSKNSKGIEALIGFEKYEKIDTTLWTNILSETFYETMFNTAAKERKELLNIHRRSREEIFNLSKFLYSPNYKMGDKKLNDNLLIPDYEVLTRIVIKRPSDSFDVINNIISKWKKQKETTKEDMSMGIITMHNMYKKAFEKEIKYINNSDISLYTIDSSQGEQFTTVIIYLDVSPTSRRISSFIKNYHRINVAVSRAKEQLIIIETKEFYDQYKKMKILPEDKNYRTFIDNIHKIPERGDSNE